MPYAMLSARRPDNPHTGFSVQAVLLHPCKIGLSSETSASGRCSCSRCTQ